MNKKVSIIIASALAVVLVVVLALSFSKKKPVEQPPVEQPTISNIDTEQPNNLDALNKAKDEDVFVPEEKIVPAEDPDTELVDKEIMDQFGIEEPDVQVFYNAEGDTDGDGMISKQEWQAWVDTHPEDLDQNMRIDEPEQHAYDTQDQQQIEQFTPTTTEDLRIENAVPDQPSAAEQAKAAEISQAASDDMDKWLEEHQDLGMTFDQLREAGWTQDENGQWIDPTVITSEG